MGIGQWEGDLGGFYLFQLKVGLLKGEKEDIY